MFISVVASYSRAALRPIHDPDQAVFSATVVAIVSPHGEHLFKIERVCKGTLTVGAVIDVPAFKLVTWSAADDERSDAPTPVPMMDSTRILMFLKPDEHDPSQYSVTDDGTAFFYRDVSKIEELANLGSQACEKYASWLSACAEPDREKRVRALYPFATREHRAYLKNTLDVLGRTAPEAGDFFAEQLPKAPPSEQGRLLYCVEKINSPKLHAAVIGALDAARRTIEEAPSKPNANKRPADLREATGILDVGLYALASFDDATDLPYFRGMAQFLMDHQLRGGLDNCLRMMRNHPGDSNVPLLLSIWLHYKGSLKSPNSPMFLTINLAAALGRQKNLDVVPTLLELLDDHDAHDTALAGLKKVTGRKFEIDSEWKAAYKAAE